MKFLTNLIADVVSDKRVQDAIESILGNLITKKIAPLVPLAAAAAAKAAIDEIVKKTPALEGVVDLVHVMESTRDTLNRLIPDIDFGLPLIDDAMDSWRPKS